MKSDKITFIKFNLVSIFFLYVVATLAIGFEKTLFFIPEDLEINNKSIRSIVGYSISIFLAIYLALKYENTKNDLYAWKNKDELINEYNKHFYEKTIKKEES